MKTLKEYSEFLYKNKYKESFAPFTFLDGRLEIVEFIKNNFHINLFVTETEEFLKIFESLEPGTEYQIKYDNYIITSAFIESPICNVSNFLDGSTNGIELVSEPGIYNKHTLELFEHCIGFQKVNLLEQELFIMQCRQEQLSWAKDNLISILEDHDYYVVYDSFFDTKKERNNSNIRIDLCHPNRSDFIIETDCLTGKPIIWTDSIDLTDKIYGKTTKEVHNILLEEVWKKDELKFGYIYNNDPHETIDTYKEVNILLDCLRYKEKKTINFDIIPERYQEFIDDYKKLNP